MKKDRPWLWIIAAWIAFLGGLGAVVTIAVRHPLPEVPIHHVQ
jgi:hypothetical protein